MRHAARIAALAVASSSLLALSACGSEEIALAKNDPYYKGAAIFSQRCAGCHTLSVAGTQGSSTSAKDKEITDGPNFNQRRETEANVLYALRNGGFSNKIMPQNLVTGSDANEVARFLAKYAGADVDTPVGPTRKAVDAGSDEVDENAETTPTEGSSFTGETTPDGDVTIEADGNEVVPGTTAP